MLTFFAIPRDFTGLFKTIQINALRSWLELGIKVIYFGNAQGIDAVSKKYKVKAISDIATNTYGTPLISEIFNNAQKYTTSELVGYINSDMILFPDLLTTIDQIKLNKFLLVGQRRPLSITEQIVGGKNWQEKILKELKKQKSFPKAGSSDFFIFPRKVSMHMPPFAVGKLYWDKWLFYWAKEHHVPIVDGTSSVTAVHQQHYFKKDDHGYELSYLGNEARLNKQLMPAFATGFTIYDADFTLTNKSRTKKTSTLFRNIRRFEISIIFAAKKSFFWLPLAYALYILRQIAVVVSRLTTR